MVRCSSCKDVDTVCVLNSLDDSWVNDYLTRLICVGLYQLTHHCWLLINFLEHIVRVSSLTDIRQVKFSSVTSTLTTVAIIVLNFNTISLDDYQLLVMDFHVLVGLTNHSHSI